MKFDSRRNICQIGVIVPLPPSTPTVLDTELAKGPISDVRRQSYSNYLSRMGYNYFSFGL